MTTTTFTLTVQAAGYPSWRTGMASGQLVALSPPNSFRSLDPCPSLSCVYNTPATWYGAGQSEVVNAYSGGVHAPDLGTHGGLVLHGGGHGDYGGNETYSLDLNTLTFSRLDDPSTNLTPVNSSLGVYADGQPLSCHSYDTLAVVPQLLGGAASGTLLRVISQAQYLPAYGTGWTYGFDLGNPSSRWSVFSSNSATFSGDGGVSCIDAQNGRIVYHENPSNGINTLRTLDLSTGQHALVNLTANAGLQIVSDTVAMIAVPDRRIGVIAGNNPSWADSRFGWFYLDDLASGVRQISFSGGSIPAAYARGTDYCPTDGYLYSIGRNSSSVIHRIEIPAVLTDPWPVTTTAVTAPTWTENTHVGKRLFWSDKCACFIFMPDAGTVGSTPLYAYVP